MIRLDALDQAETLTELNIPGFSLHGLHGMPKRYSIHVNGPWCITFEWDVGDAWRVDLEQKVVSVGMAPQTTFLILSILSNEEFLDRIAGLTGWAQMGWQRRIR